MTFDPASIREASEDLHDKYNEFGRGWITVEQFMALYLENKLDDYIEKVKRGETDD